MGLEHYDPAPTGISVRDEIVDIAFSMEVEMRKHSEEKGDSWKTMPISDLENIMENELDELRLSLNTYHQLTISYTGEVRSKIVDAMNMMWMYYKRLETED